MTDSDWLDAIEADHGQDSGEVQVSVTRLIRVEYQVPISSYDDMTRDQIRHWETKQVDDPGAFLDEITGEEVTVTFSDEVSGD